jgi:hypothetical protein
MDMVEMELKILREEKINSCVVIESSFDPGERLQAPGSLWFL